MEDIHVDLDANPGSKRPRTESSEPHANSSGKGITKLIEQWVHPRIEGVTTRLMHRAAQARKTIGSCKEAIAKLQELSAQGKVPSSLKVKLAPAGEKLLANLSAERASKDNLEKALLAEAIRTRQQELAHATVDLDAITSGEAFQREAREATAFEHHEPREQLLIEPIIRGKLDEFLLMMRLRMLDLSNKEAKEKEAAAKRAAEKERRAMDMDQRETGDILKRVVEEQVAKEMAKFRKQANKATHKQVRFEQKSGIRGKGGESSHSRSTSRGRSQSKDRDRRRGKAKPQHRGKGRGDSKPRGRSATPKPQRPKGPPRTRSTSRENSSGGRGSRPHRSPSDKRGGRERSVGASGSKTGARR